MAPLSLFDPVSGVIQLGIQQRVSARIAWSVDYGLQFKKLGLAVSKSKREDHKYYKGKMEVKYFLKTPSLKPASPYLSLQGFYFPQQYRRDSSWLITGGESYRYDYSQVDRKVLAVSLLLGNEKVENRLVLDYFFGLGLRKLTINHQPSGLVENKPGPLNWGIFNRIDRYEGTFYRPHFTLGLKVGYVLTQ